MHAVVLHRDSRGIFSFAKHIFQFTYPTIGLKIIPFPLAEYQAYAIFHVFAHPRLLTFGEKLRTFSLGTTTSSNEIGNNSIRILKEWDFMRQSRKVGRTCAEAGVEDEVGGTGQSAAEVSVALLERNRMYF